MTGKKKAPRGTKGDQADKAWLTQIRQSPERAVPTACALLRRPPAEPSIVRAAIELCKRLRAAGKHEQALRVAQAGARQSREFCLEEALAALGAGQEAIFFELLERDEALARALGPVASALRAGPAGASSGAPDATGAPVNPGSGLPPSIQAAAGLVGLLTRGDNGFEQALVGEPRIGDKALIEVLRAAGALARGEFPDSQALQGALKSVDSLGDPRASEAARQEAAERAPHLVLAEPLVTRFKGSPQQLRRALAASLRQRPSAAALGQRIAAVSHRLFDPPARPAAALLEAFALLPRDPKAARVALEVASKGGADALEVLRAGWLLKHKESDRNEGWRKGAVQILDRLADEALRSPFGAPLAARAAERSAKAWVEMGDASRANASLATARAAAPSLGLSQASFELELELIALQALSPDDPSLQSRLDAFLKANPRHLGAWQTRIGLAIHRAGKRSEEHHRAVVDAARATGDKDLLRAALPSELALKLRRPFEGLGETPSAGQLAADFEDALDYLDQADPKLLLDQALAAGAHLPAEHIFALRVAVVDAMTTAPEHLAEQHLEPIVLEVLGQLAGDQLRSGQIFSVLLGLDEDEAVLAVLGGLARRGADRTLLMTIVKLIASVGASELAEDALMAVKKSLTKQQADNLHKLLERAERSGETVEVDNDLYLDNFMPMIEKIIGDDYELSVSLGIDEDEMRANAHDEAEEMAAKFGQIGAMVTTAAQYISLPPSQQEELRKIVNRLSATRQARFGELLMEILQKGPARGAAELERFLLGILNGKVNL